MPLPVTKNGKKKPHKSRTLSPEERAARQAQHEQELLTLEQRIATETPERGFLPTTTDKDDGGLLRAFRSLPLSQHTLKGLEQAEFTRLTEIQNACIPHALAGRDILGAARTGRCVLCVVICKVNLLPTDATKVNLTLIYLYL
jgi:ATP-dependent RNA helicase DDX10/DBP4